MSKPVGAARHQHEGDDVEGAEGGPDGERREHRVFFGDGADHPPEQDWLDNRDRGQHDVGGQDQRDALLIGRQITQRSQVDLQK
jgi:hypothetical protein